MKASQQSCDQLPVCRPASASGAAAWHRAGRSQHGASLIVVLIMLSVIFLIGIISARLSLFSERSARNDRDRQIAFQSAEAALLDAELDIYGPNTAAAKRVCTFDSKKPAEFVEGCGTGTQAGMCLSSAATGDAWFSLRKEGWHKRSDGPPEPDDPILLVYETGNAASNKTVQYGQFTGQSLPSSASGLPEFLPRYIIEAVPYAGTGAATDAVASSKPEQAFLVTAIGFGFRKETQVLLQALVYKPGNKPGSGC